MEPVRSGNEVSATPRATPRLSSEGVAVLHAALERQVGSRSPSTMSGVRDAIRRISVDAKRNNWPPEWLLVAFKAAVHTLPALQRLTPGPDRDDFISRLVSLCINEYYGDSALGAYESVESVAANRNVPREPERATRTP
jgi:hypothetical protein